MIGSMIAVPFICKKLGLVGEVIDYNEFVTGKRTEGSIYGTFNLSRRIGQTIGQGCALYGLTWIGSDKGQPKVMRLGGEKTRMGKPGMLKMIHTMLTNKAVGE